MADEVVAARVCGGPLSRTKDRGGGGGGGADRPEVEEGIAEEGTDEVVGGKRRMIALIPSRSR